MRPKGEGVIGGSVLPSCRCFAGCSAWASPLTPNSLRGLASAHGRLEGAGPWPRQLLWTWRHVLQQYLAAGLFDEMLISVVPVFLGGGARLLDNLGEPEPRPWPT